MEKNISKKLLAGVLALSAGFVLASCDPVSTVPSNYNDPIVEVDSGATFKDNILGTLYNSIAGDMNSKVLDKMLKSIVEDQFGTYENFKDGSYKNKSYFEGKTETQIKLYEDDVKLRISEFFYNEITSGSYVDEDGQFSEEKLYKAHLQELYDLDSENIPSVKFYITKDFEKKDAFDSLEGDYTDYIEKKVFPEILKDKLVEDYIYRETPLVLGRSYAREISYVKVPYEKGSDFKASTLLKQYAVNYIEAGEELNFEDLVDAVKGFSGFSAEGIQPINEVADFLLNKTYGDDFITVEEDYEYMGQTLISAGDYYKETKIGKLIESFQKAEQAELDGRFPNAEDKAELDKFTSEGKTKEYGLLQKLISLAKEDYTTDGWFVKNGGANDLPSSIRDNLFSIKLANAIDNVEPEETLGVYDKKTHIRNIAGNKFVLSTDADTFEHDPYNYVYDDGSALWLCKVTEAVSPSKFNERLDVYYGKTKPEGELEKIGRQVAKVLGTKDNYIKEAYTEYLNKFTDVIFYDTSLYETIKAEYPDLDIFDED